MKVPLITVPYFVPRIEPQRISGVDTFGGYMHFFCLDLFNSQHCNAIWWRSVNANEGQKGNSGVHITVDEFSQ
jgi:hypothetical protein